MLNKVKHEMETQDQFKKRQQAAQREAFLQANDMRRTHNERMRTVDQKMRKEEKLDYFPFVSGDLIEEHRRGLN